MLFNLYEANPATIDGHADVLVQKSTAVNNVDVSALKGRARAAEQVDGELDDLLDEPFKSVGKDSKQISLASAFAAGVLYRWSGAITIFNDGVKKLNTEYEQKKAANFGVPDAPAGPSGGKSPGALAAEHDQDVKDADATLVADLKVRWGKLDLALDTAADAANTDLKDGPTEENVLALFASGDLPEAAFPLLSALGIDPKKAAEVLKHIRTLLTVGKGPGLTPGWRDLLDSIKGVDPKTASVILGALSDDELKALGSKSGNESNNSDFYSFVLAGATKEQVDRLKKLWDVNPDGKDGWQDPNSWPSLFGSGNGPTNIGANQGPVDDCWMLAKLNAIAGSDPNWPQQHVRDNGNGTISVKFYNGDGDPYWVTVTDEISLDDQNRYQTAYPDGSNAGMWAVYYEKAMAADDHSPGGLVGGEGYDGLTAGLSDSADEYMTGKESDNVKFTGINPWADPYSDVVEAHKNGEGVVAANWGNNGMPWADEDDDLKQWHVYYVKDIEADGDVVLGNPWGKDDVTLSKDQFNDYMEDVSVAKQ